MCVVEDDKIRIEVEHQMWVCGEASDEMLHVYLEAYENELAGLLPEQACKEMRIRAVKSEQAYRKEGGG
jgi:hypothetical protein